MSKKSKFFFNIIATIVMTGIFYSGFYLITDGLLASTVFAHDSDLEEERDQYKTAYETQRTYTNNLRIGLAKLKKAFATQKGYTENFRQALATCRAQVALSAGANTVAYEEGSTSEDEDFAITHTPEEEQALQEDIEKYKTAWQTQRTYTNNLRDSVARYRAAFETQKGYAENLRTALTSCRGGTILNVPFDLQNYPLSCEASALKMALGYYGINVSEDTIMATIGYHGPKHRQGDLWGNPNIAYVGDLRGRQNTTGYGVHWTPIARAGNRWRPSQAFSGWSLANLAKEINDGHPVVIWGATGGGVRPDSWRTPEGTRVSTWHGEHTWVVVGFAGSVSNPTAFYVHNPLGGARVRWSRAAFASNWARFGNSGVVVR